MPSPTRQFGQFGQKDQDICFLQFTILCLPAGENRNDMTIATIATKATVDLLFFAGDIMFAGRVKGYTGSPVIIILINSKKR